MENYISVPLSYEPCFETAPISYTIKKLSQNVLTSYNSDIDLRHCAEGNIMAVVSFGFEIAISPSVDLYTLRIPAPHNVWITF